MSKPIAKVGMAPCHPGEFIREEILNELDLPVTRAAAILDVRRATLSDLVNGKAALSPGDGPAHREGLRRPHGHPALHAGIVRSQPSVRRRFCDHQGAAL
jgi:hypothetical protein